MVTLVSHWPQVQLMFRDEVIPLRRNLLKRSCNNAPKKRNFELYGLACRGMRMRCLRTTLLCRVTQYYASETRPLGVTPTKGPIRAKHFDSVLSERVRLKISVFRCCFRDESKSLSHDFRLQQETTYDFTAGTKCHLLSTKSSFTQLQQCESHLCP